MTADEVARFILPLYSPYHEMDIEQFFIALDTLRNPSG